MNFMNREIQANGVVLDDSETQGMKLILGVWSNMLSLMGGRLDIDDDISMVDPNA